MRDLLDWDAEEQQTETEEANANVVLGRAVVEPKRKEREEMKEMKDEARSFATELNNNGAVSEASQVLKRNQDELEPKGIKDTREVTTVKAGRVNGNEEFLELGDSDDFQGQWGSLYLTNIKLSDFSQLLINEPEPPTLFDLESLEEEDALQVLEPNRPEYEDGQLISIDMKGELKGLNDIRLMEVKLPDISAFDHLPDFPGEFDPPVTIAEFDQQAHRCQEQSAKSSSQPASTH